MSAAQAQALSLALEGMRRQRDALVAEVESLRAAKLADDEEWLKAQNKIVELRAERDAARQAHDVMKQWHREASDRVEALRVEKQQLEAQLSEHWHTSATETLRKLRESEAREQRLEEALRGATAFRDKAAMTRAAEALAADPQGEA